MIVKDAAILYPVNNIRDIAYPNGLYIEVLQLGDWIFKTNIMKGE